MTKHWLQWSTFVELTEAFTAPLNLAWLLMGACIAQYFYQVVNWVNIGLFLVNIVCFDLAVNITDNYYDYLHAKDREGYAKHTNVMGRLNLPLRGVWLLGLSLYLLSLVPAVILLWRAGWSLLPLGIVGYGLGIFYAAGPFPINATPLCEAAASVGITYMVQLVCVCSAVAPHYSLSWDLAGKTFMVCLPVVLIAFTLQLANNVADLDEDIKNGRYTLAFYLGRPRSLLLMRILQVVGGLWPLVNWLSNVSPWPVLITIPLMLPMFWGMRPFYANPDKERTFFPLVKAASVYFVGYTIFLAIGVWL